MRSWSGLIGRSPDKRFTNGPVWTDYVALLFLAKFYLPQIQDHDPLEEQPNDNASSRLLKKLIKVYRQYVEDPAKLDADGELLNFYKQTMENPGLVDWSGRNFMRSYAEGGVAAYQFIFTPLTTFMGFITRLILSTLRTMRNLLIEDDKKNERSNREKAETLVVDWTGANDLITVNEKPTDEEAELAVHERIKNVKKLIKQGYQNFLLYNLPDLALTPRFAKSTDKQQAHDVSVHFNEILADEIAKLQAEYPQCKMDLFDVAKKMDKIHGKADKFGFTPAKLTTFLSSPDEGYKAPGDGKVVIPSKGYMFFDDVHPTTHTHFILAEKAFKKINKYYDMHDPAGREFQQQIFEIDEAQLIQAFKDKYNKIFKKDLLGFFGVFSYSGIYSMEKVAHLQLSSIFDHALNHGGKRTYKVLQKLGWLDQDGKLYLDNVPALKKAYNMARGLPPAGLQPTC